jgi:predicted nucleic acid-binding protein
MILVDTNLLSTFARADALSLLWELFSGDPLGVTPAIFREILEAVAQGCTWLSEVPALVKGGRIQLISATASEVLAAEGLPESLGAGEREAIAVCQAHEWTFLTNDRRARNYCREIRVEVFDLAGLLRAVWVSKLRSKKFVLELVRRIERAEGLAFKNKDAIFLAT